MTTAKPEFVSSKLLEWIDCSKPVPRRYNMGMSEFTDDSGKENTPRACVSLSLKRKQIHFIQKRKMCLQRNVEPTEISKINYSKMSEVFVPKNRKKYIWAINNYR